MLKLWAYYGLSNPTRKKFWALFSNEKTIIQKWGFIYGLFRHATNDPFQTTPTKLSAHQKIEKVNY